MSGSGIGSGASSASSSSLPDNPQDYPTWAKILTVLAAGAQSYGEKGSPEPAREIEKRVMDAKDKAKYTALLSGVVGTPQFNSPNAPGAMDPNAPLSQNFANYNPVSYQGGTLPPDLANKLGPVLRNAPPELGLPIVSDILKTEITPRPPIKASPGDTFLDPTTLKPVASIPREQVQTLTPDEVMKLGLPPGAIAQRGPTGALSVVSRGQTRPATPQEIAAAGLPPGTSAQIGPNGALTVLNKGYAPLSPQEVADKAKLAAAEQSARTNATIPDPEVLQPVAKGIASYQTPMPSPRSLQTPGGEALMRMVYQLNPNYNAQNYAKSQQAYKDFGSGKKGDLVRSFNVGISHLTTLGRLADALGSGDVQAVNSLRNAFERQFGKPAPTNFNAAKAIVGDEIIKAIVGSGGALADRENAQNQINSANSPQQLQQVINTYKELMAGQLRGLKQQYEQSTMRGDFNSLLSPEAQGQLESAFPNGAPAGNMPSGQAAQPSPQDIVNELRKRGVIQ